MTVKLDNSAGRLHELLDQAKSKPEGSGLNVWGRVFGVATQQNLTPEMEVQTLEHVIQLRMLIDQTERQISNIGDDDPSAYLKPFSRIKDLTRPSLLITSNYGTFLNLVSDGDMGLLELASQRLSSLQQERVVPLEEMQELLADVNALFDEVEASSLPDVLKSFILRQLERIRRAIQEFRIRGPERLDEVLRDIMGDLVLNADRMRETQDEVEARELNKLWQIVIRLANLIHYAPATIKVISAIAPYVPLLMPGDPNAVPPVLQ